MCADLGTWLVPYLVVVRGRSSVLLFLPKAMKRWSYTRALEFVPPTANRLVFSGWCWIE